MSERWTAKQCADHLDITVSRWRSYVSDGNWFRMGGLSHWAPAATGYDNATGIQVWDADAVRRGHASRPGRGARTDLQKRSTP